MKYLKISLTLVIFFVLLFFIGLIVFQYKNNNGASRFYVQGMEFYKDGNFQDAYFNFKQVHSFSSFYDLSLIKQYQCAMKLSDKKTAQQKLYKLSKHVKDDDIRPWAMYFEATLAQELEIYSKRKLLKRFQKINKLYPNSDFAYASAYKIAKLTDDDKLKYQKYLEYLKYAPVGKYAIPSLEEIKKYKLLTDEDKIIVADALFLNSKYTEALTLYQNTDFKLSWYNLAKCYKIKSQRDKEKEVIMQALNTEGMDPKEADSAIDSLSSYYGVNKKTILKTLYSKNPNALNTYKYAESCNSEEGYDLYKEIVDKYPDAPYASNSLWEMFWYNYKKNNYKECLELAKTHKQKYLNSKDTPRIAYWSGRIYQKQNKKQQANDIFKKIISDDALSYYAFLSAKQLDNSDDFIIKKQIPRPDDSVLLSKLFNNSKILYHLAINNDIDTLEEFKIQNEYIKSWISFKKRNYPQSIMFAKDEYSKKEKTKLSDYELNLIYPVLYEDEINKFALEYNISPYLFLSLIREESHFDKNARSRVGAIGLVQIMPDTAKYIHDESISRKDLYDKNIETGAKYFNYLTNMYEGNVYMALLAYNAGPGKIKQWMNNDLVKHVETDAFVENIPYSETKNYIKKILSSYWIYVNIYPPQK